jgi:protocatechuate 3,4-dioxygenase alpha subunit
MTTPDTSAPTPGQTVGPFFGYALPYAGGGDLVPPGRADAVQLTGRVLDGAGMPVPDALCEIRQPDEHGTLARSPGSMCRDGSTFTGWGRAATDNEGWYRFTTVRPAAIGGAVPFIAMTVFARGLLNRLFTRVYLPGAGADALLASLPEQRRRTLFAVEDGPRLRFDVRLQGEDETVFLRFPGHDD